MKTSGAALLGAVLLFLTTGAAGAITVTIDPATQELGVGSTVTLAVVVSGLGAGVAPSLSTFDLDVAFDPSVLSSSTSRSAIRSWGISSTGRVWPSPP